MGQGLGGLVAERAAPYATSRLSHADDRFLHTAPIDRAVREEGLVAILGVPLLLGKSVIGVLFAADRRTRNFGLAEVSLLCSMAAHAAIAIDAANLLDETRAALAELNAANEIVKRRAAPPSEGLPGTPPVHRVGARGRQSGKRRPGQCPRCWAAT